MLEIVLIINLWGSRNSRPKRNKKERLIFPINSHQDKSDTAHPSFLTTMGKRVISWIQWNIFEINLGYQFWGSDVWWELQNRSCFRIEYENQHWDEESKYRFVIVNMSLHKNQIWTPSHPRKFDCYEPSSFLRNSLMMKSKTSIGKTKHSAPRSRTSSSESLDGPSAMFDEEFTLDIQGTNWSLCSRSRKR